MVNSRRKGAAGEREFAALLRQSGWPEAKRGQQRTGLEQADVVDGPPGCHWEVKRVQRLQLRKALDQAIRDSPKGCVPIVAHRANGEEWQATLEMSAFLGLLTFLERHGLQWPEIAEQSSEDGDGSQTDI